MQARLKMFGADVVVTAFEDSMKATALLDAHYEDANTVTEGFEPALHDAMHADDKLVCAIRDDLGIDAAGMDPNVVDPISPKARPANPR